MRFIRQLLFIATLSLTLGITACSFEKEWPNIPVLAVLQGKLGLVGKSGRIEILSNSIPTYIDYGGYLYNSSVYAFSGNNLLCYSIASKTERQLASFDGIIEFRPDVISYIDRDNIYFNTYNWDNHFVSIYRYNVNNGKLVKIFTGASAGARFSVHNSRIYYGSKEGLYVYANGESAHLGFKGRSPTVSPDGTMLAYFNYGLLYYNCYIYNFATGEARNVASRLGYGSFEDFIRWTPDSRYLMIMGASDFLKPPLFLVDVQKGDVVSEIKNCVYHDVFFWDGEIPIKSR